MASGTAIRTPELEFSRLKRTQSKVFYESECTSPTSWEFRGIGNANLSLLNQTPVIEAHETNPFSSPLSTSTPKPSSLKVSSLESNNNSEIYKSGSRNSSGSSSTASRRSQDSGFSDAGRDAKTNNTRRSQGNKSKSNINAERLLSPSTTFAPEFENFGATRTETPVSIYVNGTPAVLHRSITTTHNCNHSQLEQCSTCIYQDVIVARSMPGTINTLPFANCDPNHLLGVGTELFGDPTCSSTPKRPSNININRNSFVQKIDNFESLNKNFKLPDNNNNSNNNSRKSSASGLSLSSNSKRNSVHSNSSVAGNYSKNTEKNKSAQNSWYELEQHCFDVTNNNHIGSSNDTLTSDLVNYSSHQKYNAKNHPNRYSLPPNLIPADYNPDNSFDNNLEKIIRNENGAVGQWLNELHFNTELECMISLQNKSLIPYEQQFDGEIVKHENPVIPKPSQSISSHVIEIRNIERTASLISEEFSRICKYLELNCVKKVPYFVLQLLDQIEDFLKEVQNVSGVFSKLESKLVNSCHQLRLSIIALGEAGTSKQRESSPEYDLIPMNKGMKSSNESSFNQSFSILASEVLKTEPEGAYSSTSQFGLNEADKKCIVMREIVDGVVVVGNTFSGVVDQRLSKHLSSILDILDDGGIPARVSLQSLYTILYDGGLHMCKIASGIRTVRCLISSIIEAKDNDEKILSLRCLATLLCVGEACRDFDQAGGFELLSDMLYEANVDLSVKFEAVAVLAQVTDPWIDLETTLCNLKHYLEKIVFSLTMIVSSCQLDDEFLLTLAAISNLTFLETSSIELLNRFRTISLIINIVVQKRPNFSIFVLDHVSTILANMAGVEICRAEIVQNNGILLLLQFLQAKSFSNASHIEVTACERLQQKSTIAISRLSSEPEVPQMILELGGFVRLIQLCRQEKERNYSDGVLLTCLATLRKLVAFCGRDLIEEFHAEDLILPNLLDSFFMYSTRQESYV